jgi:hypothetical protein
MALAMLPDRHADGFLPRTRSAEVRSASNDLLVASTSVEPASAMPQPTRRGFRPLAVAALVYMVGQTVLTAVTGAAILAVFAGMALAAVALR